MAVMIGIDPHKTTHTAVAIDNNEVVFDVSPVWHHGFGFWARAVPRRTTPEPALLDGLNSTESLGFAVCGRVFVSCQG